MGIEEVLREIITQRLGGGASKTGTRKSSSIRTVWVWTRGIRRERSGERNVGCVGKPVRCAMSPADFDCCHPGASGGRGQRARQGLRCAEGGWKLHPLWICRDDNSPRSGRNAIEGTLKTYTTYLHSTYTLQYRRHYFRRAFKWP